MSVTFTPMGRLVPLPGNETWVKVTDGDKCSSLQQYGIIYIRKKNYEEKGQTFPFKLKSYKPTLKLS